MTTETEPETTQDPTDARTWTDSGWTARVHKNEDDEGWAVSMTREGDAEPVMTGPWTMGRDKKNPKPLNYTDFRTLLKAAKDVLTRAEAHARASRHRSVTALNSTIRVDLDVAPDEDDPHALLTAWSPSGEKLAEQRVAANYKLTAAVAGRWVSAGFGEV